MVQCLKPGGILLIVEGDLQLYGEDHEPMEAKFSPESSGSWMNRLLWEAYNCLKPRGSAIDAGRFLLTWLQQNDELENEEGRKIFTPIGPWLKGDDEADTERLLFIGELMRQNSKEFVRGWKPMLLEEGFFEDTVDRWIQGTDEELGALSVHMHVQWHYACATKKFPTTLKIPLHGPTEIMCTPEMVLPSVVRSGKRHTVQSATVVQTIEEIQPEADGEMAMEL